jgi:hypothetical protein
MPAIVAAVRSGGLDVREEERAGHLFAMSRGHERQPWRPSVGPDLCPAFFQAVMEHETICLYQRMREATACTFCLVPTIRSTRA